MSSAVDRSFGLKAGDHLVAQLHQLGHFLGGVRLAFHRLIEAAVRAATRRIRNLRQPLAHVGIGVFGEEIRQLHDVTVGVVINPALRVGHFISSQGSRWAQSQFRMCQRTGVWPISV
jgi:hypothetical protein